MSRQVDLMTIREIITAACGSLILHFYFFEKGFFLGLRYIEGLVVGEDNLAAFSANVFLQAFQVDDERIVNPEKVLVLEQVFIFFQRSAHDEFPVVIRSIMISCERDRFPIR